MKSLTTSLGTGRDNESKKPNRQFCPRKQPCPKNWGSDSHVFKEFSPLFFTLHKNLLEEVTSALNIKTKRSLNDWRNTV